MGRLVFMLRCADSVVETSSLCLALSWVILRHVLLRLLPLERAMLITSSSQGWPTTAPTMAMQSSTTSASHVPISSCVIAR